MLTSQRIIFSDNSVLTDCSFVLNDFLADTQTLAVVAAQDYLFIGSEHPFNYRWIDVSTANDQASVISVHVWSDGGWNAAVDVQDDTSASGVTLARSGLLTWHIDKTKGWTKESSSENVTGITTTDIYDMYWVRLTFSGNLKATTALKYIGFKFSTDTDLAAWYPDLALSTTMTAHTSGKTNWNDQHYLAAESIIRYLKRNQVIWTPNQLIEWQLFNEAAVHRCAEIIMNSFGDAYEDNRTRASKYFREAMDMRQFKTDENLNGNLDEGEATQPIRIIRR
jgi:hypothetical protein